jgi:peptidoglycan/xylan/chitin deacetylase (PgdA/CDA1 family)
MKKSFKKFSAATIALTMLAVVILSTSNLTKAQSPSGIVTLVFDDGWNSQFNNSFPLMQEHGFVGTYYIITSLVGSGDYMNMSGLHALQAAGNEIASHSVTHPYFTNLTDTEINYECNASKQFLQSNGFPATNFAYPCGASNSHIDSIVLQYYRSARYSSGGEGYLMSIPPAPIQMSIPMGFPGETGDSNALALDEEIVQQAQETNSWVIIFFHNIVTTPLTTPWEIEQSNFAAFLNYLGNSSVQVKTVNQALNLWSSSHRVTVLPSSDTIDVGQGQTFTASAYGGTSPYKYQWFLGGNSVGTNSPSYTFNPSSVGLFSLFVNATDSAGVPITVKSNAASVTVNSAPTVSVSPISWGMDVGQSKTFTASALGGSGSYTNYQWYVGGAAQSGATTSTFRYSPESVGSYLITVTATDSLGATSVQSSAVSVTVNASPTVSVAPVGSLTMDVGQQQSFTATDSGGTGTKSYQWYLDDSAVAGQTTSTYLYTAALTSHTIYVRVTDSASTPVMTQSNIVSVTVNDAPTTRITPLSWGMDVGQSKTFTASALGGSGSYTNYQWYVGGAAQSGATTSTFRYSPESVGSYLITVTATDSLGATSVQSSAVSVTVNPTISVFAGVGGSITPTGSISVNYGVSQSFTITANAGYYIIDVSVNGSSVGAVSSYSFSNVQASYTISATFAPAPTLSPSPTASPISAPTPTPKPVTTPTPTPLPTSSPAVTPLATTVPTSMANGATVNISITGNITSSQISNATITSYQPTTTTIVSFTITGPSGTIGFSNITIPKNAISYGKSPVVYMNGQQVLNQGYTQDSNNFYVWYTTHFSTHQVKIQFAVFSATPSALLGPVLAVGITVPVIILVFSVIVFRRLRRKPENE